MIFKFLFNRALFLLTLFLSLVMFMEKSSTAEYRDFDKSFFSCIEFPRGVAVKPPVKIYIIDNYFSIF